MNTDPDQALPREHATEPERSDDAVLNFRCGDWWCLIAIALAVVVLGR